MHETPIGPPRRLWGAASALFAIAFAAWFLPAAGQAAVPVARHQLECNDSFPCHEELKRRTDFWIQVYSKWTTKQGVFHDSLHPERVYSVIEVANGCRGEGRDVERERARIRERLRGLAARVEGGKSVGGDDKVLLDLFPARSAPAIRAAAERVRCQQGNRDRFEEALKRYGSYGPMVRKLIRDSGLPDDVHYLPFVESLYNPAAYSRVGAAGLWQIMPKTARYLGLEIDATVDERLDMESATLAAIRYLKDSRNRLTAVARDKRPGVTDGELTPFVMTSYNYGVNGMRRALQEFGPDFVRVINEYKSPSFQVAVKNFYASFLAARHVARNAEEYFGKVPGDPPLRYHTVVLAHDTSMQRIYDVFGVGEEELKPLNRALTRFVWHGWRFAPKGYRLHLPYREDAWRTQVARLESLGPESDSRGPVNYTVRRGDTACGIARAFHVKCKDLVDMNRLGQRAMIRIGQVLVIPGKLGTGGTPTRVASAAPAGSYRVKAGDSPCGIAGRLGVPCRTLLAHNGLDTASVIHPGQVLKLPGGASVAEPSRGNGQDSSAEASRGTAQAPSIDAPAAYTVRPNDTPCEIAERFAMACADLLEANGLGRGSVIRVGQVLSLPGGGAPTGDRGAVADAPELREVVYEVQPGDTPCQVAERYDMTCEDFFRVNNLNRHAVIYVGQNLKVHHHAVDAVSGRTAAETVADDVPTGEEVVRDTAGEAAVSPLDSDVDLAIRTRSAGGGYRHFIVVEAEETLGHYADWLGIGSVAAIKELNGLGVNELVTIGEQLQLPVDTDEQKATFERKRQEYHRVLVEEFKENYRVRTVDNYEVRRGDSAWRLASRFELPLWVLTRYNPELRSRTPVAGDMLKVPKVESRT